MGTRYGLDADCTVVPHLDAPGVCNTCGKQLTGRKTQWCSDECQNVLRRNHDWGMARHAAVVRDERRCVRCGGDGRDQRATEWRPVLSISGARRLGIDWPDTHRPAALYVAAPRLPWLEVNHIDPRVGRGYGWGCHNHQTNLETLCHGCHVVETKRQAAERRGLQNAPQLDLLTLLGVN